MSNRDADANYHDPSQALDFHFHQMLKRVHTSVPGIVHEYDSTTKRARVQSGLNLLCTDGTSLARPVILDVPVFPRATGGWMFHHQVAVGDVVLIIFSERGLDAWKANWGEASEPGEAYFAERDAVAIPWGVETIVPVVDTGMVMQSADGETYISIQADTVTIKRGSSVATVYDDKVVIESDRVYTGAEAGAQQLVTQRHLEQAFDTHFHTTPMGPSGPPILPSPKVAGIDLTDRTRSR